jgi:hypothetical protein
MVAVVEATERAQHWQAVPGLPAAALGEAMAGAVPWVTADLIGQMNPGDADFAITINRPYSLGSGTCRGPIAASMKGHPARIATIVTLQMQQTAGPTSPGVAELRDLRYAEIDPCRRRTFLDNPALSKPEQTAAVSS